MSMLENLKSQFEGLGYLQAWDLANEHVGDIDNFVDIVDWANGNYADDDTSHLFVAIDSGGELMTTIYQFKSRNEVLKELGKVFNQFDVPFLEALKKSSFAKSLHEALGGSREVETLGIFEGGSQGTQMLAVYFQG